jgi:hypothetical protein
MEIQRQDGRLTKVKLELASDEYHALIELCFQDLRSAPDEARHLIREALRERGLLATEPEPQRPLVGKPA